MMADAEPNLSSDVLNSVEVSALLRISRRTVLEMALKGEIPCRKMGKEYRFRRDAVLDWLLGNGAQVRVSPTRRR